MHQWIILRPNSVQKLWFIDSFHHYWQARCVFLHNPPQKQAWSTKPTGFILCQAWITGSSAMEGGCCSHEAPPQPGPLFRACMLDFLWGSQGLRKTQFTIFPQWWSPNGSPAPPQAFVRLGFLSAHGAVRPRFQEEERRRPVLPNHTVQRSSAALFHIQDTPPPTLTAGSSQRRKILPMSSPALRK